MPVRETSQPTQANMIESASGESSHFELQFNSSPETVDSSDWALAKASSPDLWDADATAHAKVLNRLNP
jgi:hypothetical protein